MTILTELVRNIILIILLTTFLEMLLPVSSMQRFIKVVMGLFILIAILNPILTLIKQQNLEAFIWQLEEQPQGEFNSVFEQSTRLQKVNQDLLWENYRQKLEAQMQFLVQSVSGVEEAMVQVRLPQTEENYNEELIKEVTVTVSKKEMEEGGELIKPVKIVMEEMKREKRDTLSQEEQLIQSGVLQMLSQFFGLKEEQIKVNFI